MTTAIRPVPRPTALSAPFWDAARSGELVIQRCATCGGYEWTPQVGCSRCYTETLQWTRVSGQGTVYTYSVVYRPPTPAYDTPFVVAIVELAEGVRMMTDLIEVDPAEVRIEMPVEVTFDRELPMPLYHFRPVTA
ncbi:Zn-ribbon domain-containing OB-fold protein [Plantactinospora sp. GCM10030261]|uniref:Zn-ribbon domain-containing OB-fold protein n=1 Tax=Plantactinospora sp. GCM10030261 TaxID=3273420 RepID=UPI00360F304C